MKKITFCTLFISIFGFSQVGVGTTTPASTLDVVATNPTGGATNVDGIIIPRVSRQRALAMTSIPTSTMIYVNDIVSGTATGIASNITIVGFYIFDGTNWVRLGNGSNDNWKTTGNSGTNSTTNYVGTTDATNLKIKTNNADRILIDGTNGNVALGPSTISTTSKLEVSSGTTLDGIYGHTDNVGGVLGRGTTITFGTPAQSLNGSGVYASNPSAGYTSMFSQSTGSATVAANINFSDVWIASYNLVQNASATFNPSASYSQLNTTNSGLGGSQIASRGYLNRATLTGNPGFSIGVQGIAYSQNQDSYGVQGLSFCNTTDNSGGYFQSTNFAGISTVGFAYVATNSGGTARKIIGTNSVSEIIPTENHGRITLTCPESPEYWYQDYGIVEIINGKATIILDEILVDVAVIDDQNPIRVICTPVGMPYFNGITIMNQTNKSVEILELNGGKHSGKLQYQLVVKPKTNYGEGRFQQAPGPAYLKSDKEPLAAKAKNQPNDGRKIYRWKADQDVYNYNPEDFIAIGDVVPAGKNAGKIKLGNGKYSEGMAAEMPKK